MDKGSVKNIPEYGYCYSCMEINESKDIIVINEGLQCAKCGSFAFEEAA